MCVFSDMSKNIRVGRSEKNLLFFGKGMAKLFFQLSMLTLYPNNSTNR